MLVLKEVPLGYVHIDCDIVIWDPENIMNRLKSDYDGISYCIEKPVYDHIANYASGHFAINQFLNTQYTLDESKIFNAGFIGWKNEEFKIEFLNQFFINADKINEKYDEITKLYKYVEDIVSNGVVIGPVYDFIIEQMNFTRIAKNNNYKVRTILDSYAFHCSLRDQTEHNLKDLWKDKNGPNKHYLENEYRMGVTHYFADFKNIFTINELYKKLKNLDDPFYYSLFMSNIKRNEELYNLLLNVLLEVELTNISNYEVKPESHIAIVSKKPNLTNEELGEILNRYDLGDVYTISDELDYKFNIKLDIFNINTKVIDKIYSHLRPSYKWITFIDSDTSINLDLLNKIKDVEEYDIIIYNNIPIINTRLEYEDLSKNLNQLNTLII